MAREYIGQRPGFGVQTDYIKSLLPWHLEVWTWGGHVPSLNLNFLLYIMGVTTYASHSHRSDSRRPQHLLWCKLQAWWLPPSLSPGSKLSFWFVDGTKGSVKIVTPPVSHSISLLSSAPSFISKIQRFICWKVAEEPAWSNKQLQMVLLGDWRKSSSRRFCGIGIAAGPILSTSLCQTVAGSGALRKFLASGECQPHHHRIPAHLSLRASVFVIGDRLFGL